MKCSLGISNFLVEISILSHSIVSSISLHWSLRKAFLSLLAILWNSEFKWVYLSFSPLPLASLLFSAICKASWDNHFAFLYFFFLGIVLNTGSCTMSRTSVHSSSGSLSNLIPWIYFTLPLYNHKRFILVIPEWSRGFPHSLVGKESSHNAGDPSSIPGLGRSAGEGIGYPFQYSRASLAAQLVKNLPAMQETLVWSLSWEDLLENGKATHCSILAWRIPWTIQSIQSMGSQRVRHNWATFTFILNGLVVFPTFFNLRLNLAIRSSWSEPQSAPSLVFADCIHLLHLWLQRI